MGHRKEWVMVNQRRINFHRYNKVLVESCAHNCHECWKCVCVVMCNPEVQIKVLKNEVLNILQAASIEKAKGLKDMSR